MRFLSPLRYPGGKSALAPFIGTILERLPVSTYVEPFAGGAGAALKLVVGEYVQFAVINDINSGIVEMWHNVFERTDEFVALIRKTPVTVEEWRRQHEIYAAGDAEGLEFGFATFYLNRTNRSGILGARPIGGLDQSGKWKIDARFNKEELVERIEMIARYRSRIDVREADALDLLTSGDLSPSSVFVYADPPYLTKSQDLYMDECDWETHVGVASELTGRYDYWMVSYDDDRRVLEDLYPGQVAATFALSHRAASQRFGTEVAVFAEAISPLIDLDALGPHGGVRLSLPA